jgi:integrase
VSEFKPIGQLVRVSFTCCHASTSRLHLLQAGVDISVIALWLGHESPVTTHQYVEADLAMKERALAKLHEPDTPLQRYRAPDSLIDFLKTL